jgi:hypothetical protein
MKAGIKSSELWITAIGMIGGLIMSVAPDNAYTQVIGGLLTAVCGASYTLGRSWAKGRTGVAESQARVIAETVLKKKSSE